MQIYVAASVWQICGQDVQGEYLAEGGAFRLATAHSLDLHWHGVKISLPLVSTLFDILNYEF